MQLLLPSAEKVAKKIVLVRVDYNVPLIKNKNGKLKVGDATRLTSSLETLNFLRENQAKIVLMSHLGRPGGKVKPELSLQPVAEYLREKMDLPVKFVDDCIGESVQTEIEHLKEGEILLLENTRFYKQEKKNETEFARALSKSSQVFINDAFSAAHREHASTLGVSKFLPSFAGFHLQKEVQTLTKLMTSPKQPFLVMVGGAKISDKIGALEKLLGVADVVLVGGGVANNFLKADDIEIHHSYLQDTPADLKKQGLDYVAVAKQLISQTKSQKFLKDGYLPLPKIIYPIDVLAAKDAESSEVQLIDLTTHAKDTPFDRDLMYLDIGPKTIKLYQEIINQVKTVFWNGPLGFVEKKAFENGTKKLASHLAKKTAAGLHSVLGGGDTVSAVTKFGLEDQYSYVSTAGGAGLFFLAGEKLPGLEPLKIAAEDSG